MMMTAPTPILFAVVLAVCYFGVDVVSARRLTVLPLGDSITEGYFYRGPRDPCQPTASSYRPFLRDLLEKECPHCDIDFVGSMASGPSFDNEHEGHWGWRASHILHGNGPADFVRTVKGEPHYFIEAEGDKSISSGMLKEWIQKYPALDLVLVHLGTNDIGGRRSVDEIVNDLRQIIGHIRGHSPGCSFVLAQIIPIPAEWGDVSELNAQIAALAQQVSTKTSTVVVADLNRGFHLEEHACDRIHPNEKGARLMANGWMTALRPLLQLTKQSEL